MMKFANIWDPILLRFRIKDVLLEIYRMSLLTIVSLRNKESCFKILIFKFILNTRKENIDFLD